ncbi:MAG TPA: hypothetical protein VMU19_09980 [Bryobacteraceae bacterium]|nr:hypothetical protein [Bryobacteraceae bacterium]
MSNKVFATLLVGLFAATAAYADIQVTVLPSLAPNFFGSPSWDGYTANAIYAIENGLTSYGDPNSPTYYSQANHFTPSQTIVTGFPSWLGQTDPGSVFGAAFANELGNRMHFGFDISASGGETFELDDISFNSVSSPNAGLDWGWGAGPWYYSPIRIGIAADGTIYDNYQDGSLPVVQVIYVGSGNSYDAYCDTCTTADQQAALDAAALAGGDYWYTGTYSVTGSSGATYSGSATFYVGEVPEPSSILLAGVMLLASAGALRRCSRSRR